MKLLEVTHSCQGCGQGFHITGNHFGIARKYMKEHSYFFDLPDAPSVPCAHCLAIYNMNNPYSQRLAVERVDKETKETE